MDAPHYKITYPAMTLRLYAGHGAEAPTLEDDRGAPCAVGGGPATLTFGVPEGSDVHAVFEALAETTCRLAPVLAETGEGAVFDESRADKWCSCGPGGMVSVDCRPGAGGAGACGWSVYVRDHDDTMARKLTIVFRVRDPDTPAMPWSGARDTPRDSEGVRVGTVPDDQQAVNARVETRLCELEAAHVSVDRHCDESEARYRRAVHGIHDRMEQLAADVQRTTETFRARIAGLEARLRACTAEPADGVARPYQL